MTPAFRKQMLRQAAFLFLGLLAILLILVGTLGRNAFFIAAFVLVPVTALTFNFLQRRQYRAAAKENRHAAR